MIHIIKKSIDFKKFLNANNIVIEFFDEESLITQTDLVEAIRHPLLIFCFNSLLYDLNISTQSNKQVLNNFINMMINDT